MSLAPSLILVVKLKIEDVWDSEAQRVFATPENLAESLMEDLKAKLPADEAEIVTVEIVKPV